MHRSRRQQCVRFRWLAAVCFWASSGTSTFRTDRGRSRSVGTRQINFIQLRHNISLSSGWIQHEVHNQRTPENCHQRQREAGTSAELTAPLELEAFSHSWFSIKLEGCCR